MTTNERSNWVQEPFLDLPVKQGWGAFMLAAVEAVCVFTVGAAKAGFLLGGMAAFAAGWSKYLHRDLIRIPVLLTAIAGAGLNLYVLWRRQRLRNAPAAAWRKKALTKREQLRIVLVLSLAILTLAFVISEIYLHRLVHNTII
jgi:hypothetical protein